MPSNSHIFQQIQTISYDLGFVAVGYSAIKPLCKEMERYEQAMDNSYFAELGYLKRNLEKREDPSLLVEGARSVLVFLAPYGENIGGTKDEFVNINISQNSCLNKCRESGIKENGCPEEVREKLQYKVAQYALGEDYHVVIRNKLATVLEYIKSVDSSIIGRVFVDTAPVLERAWAVQAGLGFIGKNNFFISREHGIRNFIGVIISSFEIKDNDKSVGKKENVEIEKKYCGSCTKCLEACPTGALCKAYTLDARKCISYLTIENKESSFEKNIEMADMHEGWIFGCDACMNACPWNNRNKPGWNEFTQCSDPLPYTHLRRR